jgi:hypothetical protein
MEIVKPILASFAGTMPRHSKTATAVARKARSKEVCPAVLRNRASPPVRLSSAEGILTGLLGQGSWSKVRTRWALGLKYEQPAM